MNILNLLKREFLFFIFLFLLFILSINNPKEIFNFYNYINWSTIRALFILLILTTAIKLSNFFDLFAIKFLNYFKTEKSLAIFFIIFSAILSMFLTNDITLFIIVPITLSIATIINNDVTKLVIFEAMATNVGSLLTPIGNPQNLYLFREWDISFLSFIQTMLPIFIIKFLILLFFVFINFSSNPIKISNIQIKKIDKNLFIHSIIFFILFIITLDIDMVRFLIPIITIWFFILKKEIFYSVDWFLLTTFILMFIDFNMIAKIDFIIHYINSFNLNFFNVMNLTILSSQIMSNVPATIFISKFSTNFEAIAFGANIAGSSLILASLANIIAIRMLNNSKHYLTFHKYSIPYFLTSYSIILIYMIF